MTREILGALEEGAIPVDVDGGLTRYKRHLADARPSSQRTRVQRKSCPSRRSMNPVTRP